MSNWKKVEPLKEVRGNPCLICSAHGHDPQKIAPLDMIIAVGFGNACLTKNGKVIWDEQRAKGGEYLTVRGAEKLALEDPDNDWRIEKHGPLHGETYQRHGKDEWVCIEQNEGFE
jgi:hypothetical protein